MNKLLLSLFALWFCGARMHADETWPQALASMPLNRGITWLDRTNCVQVMLSALQSNATVKALVFMPGATDEFYMFKRARAKLGVATPTLLDAVAALTNQTLVRVTFRPPLLLLHSDEDTLEPLATISHEPTAAKLKSIPYLPHVNYYDRDWDAIQPDLSRRLRLDLRPWRYYYDSWHFYRHSYAGWGLSGWEALEATALAGKSSFVVKRRRVEFEPDGRFRQLPKLDAFPR